jgi:hypothetical protein
VKRISLGCAAAAGFGLAVSSGVMVCMVFAAVFPVLPILQNRRRTAYLVTFAYYLAASWPVVVSARNYFDSGIGIWVGPLLWAAAGSALAFPWFCIWCPHRSSALWRVPIGVLGYALPPLGLIEWAHPFTGAGFLFPGTGWIGLGAVLLMPGLLVSKPRYTSAAVALGCLLAHQRAPKSVATPDGWIAVNTSAQEGGDSMLTDYASLRTLSQATATQSGDVIVFPESTVRRWNPATEAFWKADLHGIDLKPTVILGAQIPEIGADELVTVRSDIENSVRCLRGESLLPILPRRRPELYRNVVVLLEHQGTRIVDQHIPVPFAMWKPFTDGGVRLQWGANRVLPVVGQRVCILICYEALLVWPVLSSLLDRPTLFCVVANDRWVDRTPIPRYRKGVLKGWSLLFGIPFLEASNR